MQLKYYEFYLTRSKAIIAIIFLRLAYSLDMSCLVFFCIAGSQVRAGMHCWFRDTSLFTGRSASPRQAFGLGRVCLAFVVLQNLIYHRMLVREPVHGMQGAGVRQKLRTH